MNRELFIECLKRTDACLKSLVWLLQLDFRVDMAIAFHMIPDKRWIFWLIVEFRNALESESDRMNKLWKPVEAHYRYNNRLWEIRKRETRKLSYNASDYSAKLDAMNTWLNANSQKAAEVALRRFPITWEDLEHFLPAWISLVEAGYYDEPVGGAQ